MATEIEKKIARRLFDSHWESLGVADITGAWQAMNQAEKENVAYLIKHRRYADIGKVFAIGAKEQIKAKALAEAQSMLADGSLSEAELQRILE